jgi:hypothetical protein
MPKVTTLPPCVCSVVLYHLHVRFVPLLLPPLPNSVGFAAPLLPCRPFTVSSRCHKQQAARSRSSLSVRATGAQDRQLLTPLRAADEQQQPSAFDYEEPETAKEGIDLGLVMCKQGR